MYILTGCDKLGNIELPKHGQGGMDVIRIKLNGDECECGSCSPRMQINSQC